MDSWQEREQLWEKTKQALQLITPDGELNTREQAEAVLAETLPHLPDSDFAKAKRQLQQPEMLNYLDRVQEKIAALPFAEEVKQAAVHQQGLRRRPEALQGESTRAAALRGSPIDVRRRAEQSRRGGLASGRRGAGYFPPGLSGQQLGGMHQQRAAHAPSRPPAYDAGSLRSQTPVLELPQVRRWSPPPTPRPTSVWEWNGHTVCIGGTCSN